ncbi:hypothetical protein SZ25_00053 [Candidatus Arcanobacter lacustris]|jgi:hypothetical protein|uniref:Uncharacterized protein n=1 Tax=Candidatus Arcanibacter lacustris TaxID=1607817 RepID=A0A0F5MS21_9RICK|nr:hypothetical protein SZ25_00053 [Candidatus Arcanobacter lacustris]
MYTQDDVLSIKQVGVNGQISLGKEYAGKQVQISKLDDGTIVIKPGKFIPDNERWIHAIENKRKIDDAIEWAEKNIRSNNFDEIAKKIEKND